jgi:hypothetical protein
MGKSNKRLLVHKDMQSITTIESVDIILTPQFYTFLREELGVKFSYQAKQIAPSLFDDYLDSGKEYQFHVYKCEDDWCFFAYSIDDITSFLETKGVNSHQISKIFFAQELNEHLRDAIDLSPSFAMQSIDNEVALLPKRLISAEYKYSNIDLSSLSLKNGIALGSSYDSLVPLNQTIVITLLFTILGVIFFIEGGRINSSIANSVAQEETLLEKNPRLSSARVRKSILGEYEPIDKRERRKREAIKDISKMIFAGTTLKEIIVDDQKVSATIETKKSSTIRKLEREAKNFKIKKEGSNIIKMERAL